MVADLEEEARIELSDLDMIALVKVTEQMREMGYKFRFIEVVNTSGETVKNELLISIAHLL